jgi:hypothetical protein
MAVPATVAAKQRARRAAWISLFTFGFGGLFYTGHWIMGLALMSYMFVAFLAIFVGVGLILFPMGWIAGVAGTYQLARRDVIETAILTQADQSTRREQILGSEGTALQ